MATTGKSNDEVDDELKDLDREINELRSAKKELFAKTRSVNEELERIAKRERECVDKQHRLRTEQHDREKRQQTIQRVTELESQLQTAKYENTKLSDKIRNLKRSLDEAAKYSKAQNRKINELENSVTLAEGQMANASAPTRSDSEDSVAVVELQKQLSHTTKLLSETKEELKETRQRLSGVQERLTVSEQVTAATQLRKLQECGNSEQLQLELTPQHQPTTHAGGYDVLRALYSELTTMLDARIVAANMYQRNALTLKELQTIQSLKDRPVEAAETLLNTIMDQPDAVYLCFLDVLKHTEQLHIYRRLVEDGYKDYDERSSHTSVIREHYVFLLETLDVNLSGLVHELYSKEVVSAVEKDDIGAEKTSFRANEKLLSVLSRKSPQQFQLFLDALDNCGQQHVRDVIADHRPDTQKTNIVVSDTLQVAASAEDVTLRERLVHFALKKMIYQFLVHTVDLARGNLIDKLVIKDVISSEQKETVKKLKKNDAKEDCLMTMLREKSAAEFESFLATLSETGQHSVADVVRRALHTVGETGHNPLQYYLHEKGRPVRAVTSLAGEIYLLRDKERDQVEVYDVITYRLSRRLTVPNVSLFTDITSCEYFRCAYIGDHTDECVHRLDVQGAITRWAVNDKPQGLSVNAAHNVIVICRRVQKMKEFSSHGELLREITSLPADVVNPWHAIQTRSGQFIVCHGYHTDPIHRVCMISADGRHVVHSHGGPWGSDSGQYNVPTRLAVDDNGFVFVADLINSRVTLLSPTLEYVRDVVSRDRLKGSPRSLYLDTKRRLLYAAVNKQTDDRWKGRVVVFPV